MSSATAFAHQPVANRFRTLPRSCDSPSDVQDAHQRADEVKTAQVRAALNKSGHQLLSRIRVHVKGTLVRLTGQVTSYYQKQQATTAVLALAGVERLENELEVCR